MVVKLFETDPDERNKIPVNEDDPIHVNYTLTANQWAV